MKLIKLIKLKLINKINCNCCCEIVKLIHSPWMNENSANAFVHLTRYMESCPPSDCPNSNPNLEGFVGGQSSVG